MVPKRKFPMQLSSGQRTSRIILILFDFDANKRSNPTQSKSDIVLTNVGASMEKDGIWAAKSLNIPACDSTYRISMRSGKWQRKKEAIKRKKNTNDWKKSFFWSVRYRSHCRTRKIGQSNNLLAEKRRFLPNLFLGCFELLY